MIEAQPPLFPGFDPPKPEPLSVDQRRTIRQAVDISRGIHPLTRGPIHPEADLSATKDDIKNLPFRCGSCTHRVLMRHNNGTYPKCDEHVMNHSAATDVRAWWPACPSYEPVEDE